MRHVSRMHLSNLEKEKEEEKERKSQISLDDHEMLTHCVEMHTVHCCQVRFMYIVLGLDRKGSFKNGGKIATNMDIDIDPGTIPR